MKEIQIKGIEAEVKRLGIQFHTLPNGKVEGNTHILVPVYQFIQEGRILYEHTDLTNMLMFLIAYSLDHKKKKKG